MSHISLNIVKAFLTFRNDLAELYPGDRPTDRYVRYGALHSYLHSVEVLFEGTNRELSKANKETISNIFDQLLQLSESAFNDMKEINK